MIMLMVGTLKDLKEGVLDHNSTYYTSCSTAIEKSGYKQIDPKSIRSDWWFICINGASWSGCPDTQVYQSNYSIKD